MFLQRSRATALGNLLKEAGVEPIDAMQPGLGQEEVPLFPSFDWIRVNDDLLKAAASDDQLVLESSTECSISTTRPAA